MKKFVFLFFFCFFFVFPCYASGSTASFSLEIEKPVIQLNEEMHVQVFVNSPKGKVNTVYLSLDYSLENLILKKIIFPDSVFPHLIEKDDSTPGLISLTAFNPDPYQGEEGFLATLIFRAQKQGEASISILPSSKIHLNDGWGTDIFDYRTSPERYTFDISGEAETISLASRLQKIREQGFRLPEQNVVDYTVVRQTKVKKLINQVKSASVSSKEEIKSDLIKVVIQLALFLSLSTAAVFYFSHKGKKK